MSAPCTTCGLPVDQPAHLSPPDENGRCAACTALRAPGMLERLAANAMPACYTPTRETVVRLAALSIELRGGTRQ